MNDFVKILYRSISHQSTAIRITKILTVDISSYAYYFVLHVLFYICCM